jgi:hypothetical protein
MFPESMQKRLADVEPERKRPAARSAAARPRTATRRPG